MPLMGQEQPFPDIAVLYKFSGRIKGGIGMTGFRTLMGSMAFLFIISIPAVVSAQTFVGARCVAKLDNGNPLIVHMPEFTQEKCETALKACAKGRNYSDPHYFEQMMVIQGPSTLSGFRPEICEADSNARMVVPPIAK